MPAYRPKPKPTPGPVKPGPKGGKVVNRKIEDTKQVGYGATPRKPAKPTEPVSKGKRKPVMPRQGR
jgi:hypothetical protein